MPGSFFDFRFSFFVILYLCAMILIYTPQLGPRIKYIFKLIFSDLLGNEVVFSSDIEELIAFEGPKINYSGDDTLAGLFFQAEGLLNEKEIDAKDIKLVGEGEELGLFHVYNENSALNFDPFAAAFYLVTRYEEYLPYVRDEYGRFQAKESIAWQHGFLDKPMVNIWANKIASKIKQTWPAWSPGHKEYRFIPTIDMNAAWMYKRKGFFRTTAGIAHALTQGQFASVLERIRVISNRKPDPFDTYTDQLALHKQYDLDTIYFILFADYDNNDRNIQYNNRHFNVLIKGLSDYCNIGIHTSYASLKSSEKLELEFKRLSSVLNKEITSTRQHFHVLKMPQTYRNFVNKDVTNDYSMGYAVTPGFRAGICDPFNFYDLDFEVETNMKVWPYSIVDKGLLAGYKIETTFKPIINRVKSVNGTMITLWNNESLMYEGTDRLNLSTYEKIIKIALP